LWQYGQAFSVEGVRFVGSAHTLLGFQGIDQVRFLLLMQAKMECE
jgi:hypothetical protein